MPYYRHNTEQIIYSLTERPAIRPSTHKGKHSGWIISGTLETTYAHNPTDPSTGRLTHPTTKAARSEFEAKDSEQEALAEYFRRWQPPDTTEIAATEYQQLRRQFSSKH